MPAELSINWLFIQVYGITVIAAIYGSASAVLLALSRRPSTILVSSVFLAGWVVGIPSDTPLAVYVIVDWAFGMLLLSYVILFTHRWWVWTVGTIYGLMLFVHGAYAGVPFLPQITWSQHYWCLTALFTLQLLVTGRQIYRDRITVASRNNYSRRRLPDILHGNQGMGRSK